MLSLVVSYFCDFIYLFGTTKDNRGMVDEHLLAINPFLFY